MKPKIDEVEKEKLIEYLNANIDKNGNRITKAHKADVLDVFRTQHELTNIMLADILGKTEKEINRLLKQYDNWNEVQFDKERKCVDIKIAIRSENKYKKEALEELKRNDPAKYKAIDDILSNRHLYKDKLEYDDWNYRVVEYYDGNPVPLEVPTFEYEPESVYIEKESIQERLEFFKDQISNLKPKQQEIINYLWFDNEGNIRPRKRTLEDASKKYGVADSTLHSRYDKGLKIIAEKRDKEKIEQLFYDSYQKQMLPAKSVIPTPFEYWSNEKPCKVMDYFRSSFKDDKTVCPGSFIDAKGKYLDCVKRLITNAKPFEGVGKVLLKEACKLLGRSEEDIYRWLAIGKLSGKKEPYPKGWRWVIDLSNVRDCGQGCYFRDSRNPKFKLDKTKLIKMTINNHYNINM